jgi:16S rRNA (cytidine1402-2'-O)-methyltransferase
MGRIREGQAVAMVSDAGTPLVSDPGYKLVQACIDAEIDVVPVPGASSVLTALQLSGVPSEAFSFIGFLPQKSKARQDVLKRWADVPGALVAFETAPRLLKSLQDILAVLGDRQVAVTRELTKLYEEAKRDNVASLIAHYDSDGLPKGEIVLVIGPQAAGEADEAQVRDMLQALIDDGMRTKEAAAQVALTLEGWSKSDLYALALEMQKGHP